MFLLPACRPRHPAYNRRIRIPVLPLYTTSALPQHILPCPSICPTCRPSTFTTHFALSPQLPHTCGPSTFTTHFALSLQLPHLRAQHFHNAFCPVPPAAPPAGPALSQRILSCPSSCPTCGPSTFTTHFALSLQLPHLQAQHFHNAFFLSPSCPIPAGPALSQRILSCPSSCPTCGPSTFTTHFALSLQLPHLQAQHFHNAFFLSPSCPIPAGPPHFQFHDSMRSRKPPSLPSSVFCTRFGFRAACRHSAQQTHTRPLPGSAVCFPALLPPGHCQVLCIIATRTS